MIEIKQIKDSTNDRFAAMDEGKQAGAIFYTTAEESKIILDHTEVDDAYRGQSIGKKILMWIVEFARENNIKIIPECPYAKSVFEKTESIRDVLSD